MKVKIGLILGVIYIILGITSVCTQFMFNKDIHMKGLVDIILWTVLLSFAYMGMAHLYIELMKEDDEKG